VLKPVPSCLLAMVSLASGHYHLSKRKTGELMADFFQADVSLGSVSAHLTEACDAADWG